MIKFICIIINVTLLYISCLFSAVAVAVDWQALSTQEKTVLKQFESQWTALPTQQQEKLQLGANRWISMDASKRSQTLAKFENWQKMDPQQREKLQQKLIVLDDNLQKVKEVQAKESALLHDAIAQHKISTEKHNTELREEISGLSNQLSEQQSATQAIVGQQQQKIKTLSILAVSGLVLAVSSIAAFVWQHKNLLEL